MSYANARFQWEDGERRVRAAASPERAVLEGVVSHLVEELRRRMGGPFGIDELVALYRGGTDWALPLAMELAPGEPLAWDAQTVADAAFARYAREARDFAGGRRIETA